MSTAAPLQNTAAKTPLVGKSPHAGLLLQCKCACCGSGASAINGECEECKKKRLQKKLSIGANNDPLELEADRAADQVMAASPNRGVSSLPPRIQRFTGQTTGDGSTAPASVDRVLSGSGRPLDQALQQDMGRRFEHDFSQVRVHTGTAAEQSARDVNAYAYTVGHNIVFGSGRFAPESYAGRKLIAHELTHVVQQSRSDGKHIDQNHVKGDISVTTHNTAQRQVAIDEDQDERHRISFVTESNTPFLRRQLQNFPPPPPLYPHFSQIYGDVSDKIGELEMTCGDRRERGFWIFWDESTKKAYPGDIVIGEPGPKNCKPAEIELGPMPRDHGNILVAGWFHNHPPQWPGCMSPTVGPSRRDKDTSSKLKLPGLVQDFMKPGPNNTCRGNPRGTFFFGPPRRGM